MPTYKLYYFGVRGRGEVIRLIFKYAGVEFEDIRVEGKDWPKLKETMPYKHMPVLEVDGKRLSQSQAIMRYVGRELGLVGKTPFDAAKADEFLNAQTDVMQVLPLFEKDKEKQKELMKVAMTEKVPPLLQTMENNMVGSYYCGDQVTYADIAFANNSEYLTAADPKCLDATPKLKAIYERIHANPNIAKYIAQRPKTDI